MADGDNALGIVDARGLKVGGDGRREDGIAPLVGETGDGGAEVIQLRLDDELLALAKVGILALGDERDVGVVDGQTALDGVVGIAAVDVDITVGVVVVGKFRHNTLGGDCGALALGQRARETEGGGNVAKAGVVEEGAEGDVAGGKSAAEMAVGGERHVDVGTARVGVDHGGSGDDTRRGARGTATKADEVQRLQYLE